MATSQTTTNKATADKGPNGKAAETASKALATPAPTTGKRGRKALDSMTPDQLKAWKETHVPLADLIAYTDGNPNVSESVKLFTSAFNAYIVHRPTEASLPTASKVETLPPEMLSKIEKIAADAFAKKASDKTYGVRSIPTEPFITFIFQSLGIDPFDAEEKRKSILRVLVNSLGYEKVKIQLTEDTKTNKAGEFVVATGKHAHLFRPEATAKK